MQQEGPTQSYVRGVVRRGGGAPVFPVQAESAEVVVVGFASNSFCPDPDPDPRIAFAFPARG